MSFNTKKRQPSIDHFHLFAAHDIFLVIKHRRSTLNASHIACDRGFRISYLKPKEQDLYQVQRGPKLTSLVVLCAPRAAGARNICGEFAECDARIQRESAHTLLEKRVLQLFKNPKSVLLMQMLRAPALPQYS
jgi:hypothetical protein